jgi:hypothetical protein
MTILFNRLAYKDRLTRAGVQEDQAQRHLCALSRRSLDRAAQCLVGPRLPART